MHISLGMCEYDLHSGIQLELFVIWLVDTAITACNLEKMDYMIHI